MTRIHPGLTTERKPQFKKKNATYKIYSHKKDNPVLIYRLKFLQEG